LLWFRIAVARRCPLTLGRAGQLGSRTFHVEVTILSRLDIYRYSSLKDDLMPPGDVGRDPPFRRVREAAFRDPEATPGHQRHAHGRSERADLDPESVWRVWLIGLASALLAGLIGWFGGDAAASSWHWAGRPREAAAGGPGRGEGDSSQRFIAARNDAEKKNAAIVMGALGGILGVAFGMAGGICRRSVRWTAVGGWAGLVFGPAVGVAVAFAVVPLFYRYAGRPPNPSLPLLCHTAMYSGIGASGGMAFGLGFRGWTGAARGLVAGAMGGGLGSLIYNVFHTYAFPLEWDFSPLPGKTTSRLLAHLFVAVAAIICIVVAAGERQRATLRETDDPLDER
jgi:hypothetical protein